jgi:hypothetical protein
MFFKYVDFKTQFQPKQTSYNTRISIAKLVFYDKEYMRSVPFLHP